MSHVALYVTKDIAGYLRQRLIARNLKPFQIRNRKLSLIVEHLFKVRNEPSRVHCIAMETAGELVVHPALRHGPQREQHHVRGFLVLRALEIAEQEIVRYRTWKFWRAAKSAEL